MKAPVEKSPSPTTGPQYWRSLDEMADTPEFRRWVENEFPAGASELNNPLTRRHFVQLMSASFLLAGLGMTGCRRPEERIHPFSKMPENYVHGMPQYYATSMPGRDGAQPLLVKSIDGRPIKIEGNPKHPHQMPGTDRYAQASILDLYDPDRSTQILSHGIPVTREAALDFISVQAGKLRENGGAGVAFLLAPSNSPSRARLQKALQTSHPKARWFECDPADAGVQRQAATLAHASPPPEASGLRPFYHLDRAKIILSLDADFLGSEADGGRLINGFARGRRIENPASELNRLYLVEPLMTLTGASADHRLRATGAQVGAVAARLAAEVLAAVNETGAADLIAQLQKVALPAEITAPWIVECARDLVAHRENCVVLAGYRQPLHVHLLAAAMNRALGNEGKTVDLLPCTEPASGTISELAQALNAGEIQTLVIAGGNPVYHAPVDLNWAGAQRKAALVIRLGLAEDETSAGCDWHFPAAHYLESWGDARSSDGTLISVQPLIAPLFGGFTELELLARLGGQATTNPYEIVRETFKHEVPALDFEHAWKAFLRDGFAPETAARHVRAGLNWPVISRQVETGLREADAIGKADAHNLEVIFSRDYRVDDGRFNNNAWLQEMPDPITKVCWDNVATLSAKTARELGVYFKNPELSYLKVPLITVELEGRTIQAPVWVQPGQADNTIGLTLGYGRTKTGRVGLGAGYNAYGMRRQARPFFALGGKISPTNQTRVVATTQDHWAMEARPVVREANLEQFRQHPDFVSQMDLDSHMPPNAAIYQHPNDKVPGMKGIHQWGLTVDLNSCVGCGTCVMACQSENNIPIVGREQVARGREMHWIRIDRYYSARPDDADLAMPQVVNQPMLCQHCENAPCENVCPVNATVHDDEGLNMMVYNRCIGTRYCSNNCPYKVRRFNFFDYNQRPIDKLYLGPLAPKGMPDIVQMAKNPDVTVRMRGVMEKCTFCIQRIEQAKIAQKIKAKDSDQVRVPDGTITPACAQACPAEAIVFGDVSDPESRVSRLKQQARNYSVLGFLNTKPRTTYLARIRNPNPKMPDYLQQPLSLAEYSREHGDPMSAEAHGAEGHPQTNESTKGAH
jgi:molybdopterin-containing oxidoreductase family iron-sulfur binding subunit